MAALAHAAGELSDRLVAYLRRQGSRDSRGSMPAREDRPGQARGDLPHVNYSPRLRRQAASNERMQWLDHEEAAQGHEEQTENILPFPSLLRALRDLRGDGLRRLAYAHLNCGIGGEGIGWRQSGRGGFWRNCCIRFSFECPGEFRGRAVSEGLTIRSVWVACARSGVRYGARSNRHRALCVADTRVSSRPSRLSATPRPEIGAPPFAGHCGIISRKIRSSCVRTSRLSVGMAEQRLNHGAHVVE